MGGSLNKNNKWPVFQCFCVFSGEVFDYLVAHGRMKEKEARAKFRQVSETPQLASTVCLSVSQPKPDAQLVFQF